MLGCFYMEKIKVDIKKELPSNYREAEWVCEQAFYNLFDEGCSEHYLLHLLRDDKSYIPELTRLAFIKDELVGGIYYSKAKVIDNKGVEYPVITFGPLFVKPEYQKHGIGALLMRETFKAAKEDGYSGIIIFGHPAYYPKFGFKDCSFYGIATETGDNFPPFMALKLNDGFDNIHGRYFDADLFKEITIELGHEYDKNFPPLKRTAPKLKRV